MSPAHQPLVSIIVRSMDRPELSEALASVASSDYDAVEIIVVNAKGGDHVSLSRHSSRFKIHLVNTSGLPLERATAANAGISAASGDFALFLDDDDLIDPNHISRLATALQNNPDYPAAYTGIRLLGKDGKVFRETNIPWAQERLLGINFLPIHSVLFRCNLARDNCCFDTTLEILEDWDFWLQLSRHGDFLNLPGCTATYRMGLGQSGLSANRDMVRFKSAHAQVLQKWARTDGFLPITTSLLWFGSAVEDLQTAIQSLQSEREAQQLAITSLKDELSRTRWERDSLSQARDSLLNSTSWRITSPLRALSHWIKHSKEKND